MWRCLPTKAATTALDELFHGRTSPLSVIKWKGIYERLEAAVGRGEKVANLSLRTPKAQHMEFLAALRIYNLAGAYLRSDMLHYSDSHQMLKV